MMLRYLIILACNHFHFSISTLIVNVLGCFIFGLVLAFSDQLHVSEFVKVCLMVGLCGALTTFSSFAYDLIRLLANQQFNWAIIYFIGTNVLSIIGFGCGYLVPTLFKS